MRNTINFTLYICTFCILFGLVNSGLTQVREKRIHDRGMLHETVFNTGTIGRPYQFGDAGNRTTSPAHMPTAPNQAWLKAARAKRNRP